MNSAYDRFHTGVMTVGARVFGAILLLIGFVFLLFAILGESSRTLHAIGGILMIVLGAILLVVKVPTLAEAKPFFEGTAENRRTGTYEKRK
jgi:membrane-bound ClpP family serine protease